MAHKAKEQWQQRLKRTSCKAESFWTASTFPNFALHCPSAPQKDQTGKTPLLYACARDKGEFVEMLVSHGARLDVEKSTDGQPRASSASSARHTEPELHQAHSQTDSQSAPAQIGGQTESARAQGQLPNVQANAPPPKKRGTPTTALKLAAGLRCWRAVHALLGSKRSENV